MCVYFLISEVVIIKKDEIVEANLHDKSTMIQRCFDMITMMTTKDDGKYDEQKVQKIKEQLK